MSDAPEHQELERPSPVRRLIGLSLLTAGVTVQLIYELTGFSPWEAPHPVTGIAAACGLLLLFTAHLKVPSVRTGPGTTTRVVPATLAWTIFCAVTSLSLTVLPGILGLSAVGLLHAHPIALWASLAAFYGSCGCIPVLLLWGAWAASTHRLGWLRFLGLLPLHTASVGLLWLVFWLDANTVSR